MSKSNFFIIILFFFLLYNGIDTQLIMSKPYPIDDLVVLLMFCYVSLAFLMSKVSLFKIEIYMLWMFALFLFLGFSSNLIWGNANFITVILDVWSVSKFLFVYLFARVFFDDSFTELTLNKIAKISMLLAYIFFILVIFNLMFNFWGYFEYRNGLPSQYLFFSHPTYLASSSLVLAFFIAQSKINNFHLIPILTVILFTGRNKAIIFLVILIFIIIFMKYSKKIPYLLISFITILIIFLFKDIIYFRLLSQETSVRSRLYDTSIALAETYFPLGSGFGTFASFASVKNYSPIYFDYGMNNIYGFSPENPMYLMDGYFAMGLGQFGLIGFTLLVSIIFSIFYLAIKKSEYSLLSLSISFYVLISLFTESLLSTSLGLGFMLILGRITIKNNKRRSFSSN